MSCQQSTSTTIPSVSNRNNTTREANANKSEKWEIDVIGNFVVYLYHRLIITPHNDWCVEKSKMRAEYLQQVGTELRQKLKDNIGTLLYRCGFLLNSKRGSSLYKIKCKALFDFRNDKLKELDNLRRNSEGTIKDRESFIDNAITFDGENFEVDESQPKIPLEYQGTKIRRRLHNFYPNNMSCCICQENFHNMDAFEEHIQTHGDDTDFEFLNKLDKFTSPIFTMSYRLCQNSHNFCFEFETNLENLIIEKIIIVQSRSFFYVHNTHLPYKCPENGKCRFFVDSHLFTIHVEQPIVLICHMEDNMESLTIEQHHFMRSEEFPKVHFSINPYRLPHAKLFEPRFKLADYFPPKEIKDALKGDFYYENLMKTSNAFRDYVRNAKNLQPQTIGESLNILLQIEDIDTMQQYLGLTQKNIKVRSYGDEYSFQLKPKQRIFLENVLTVYDEVVLTTRTEFFTKPEEIIMKNTADIVDRMENTFVGLVQAINSGRVSFSCNRIINIRDSYTVICRPSRLTLRYQYRSLQLLPDSMRFLKNFLFPAKIVSMSLSSISLNLYNKHLNDEQLQAVRNIAQGPRTDATYIVFGPPGTGKTTTLVESILQLLKKPENKILVTAYSNSACDQLALQLLKYLKQLDMRRGMVRIYSRSCEIRTEGIDDDLLENSNMYSGQFYPDIEILHEYRVVICTLSVVAKLATGKFGRKKGGAACYTHLFIDEAAAAMETEALMAITTILMAGSHLIIAGDHKQLGPILKSERAKELGLDTSLMERLLARDCYRVDVDNGDYDRTIQTRLVRNYRSHPAIVNLFSGLYYNHSLEALVNPDDVSLGKIWHKSRNKEYPILFHAAYEPSKSDKQSHSLYNYKELHIVMNYVKDLMYFGINGKPVKESDIGIISPYKKQYQRIQEELNLRKWFEIETGSVEIFQGKEKNIIIVSFVRSCTENLGFLDNPRRLNVTISRPKSLLILIGNPKTLSLNSDFEYIIKECQRNNTFVCSNSTSKGMDPLKQSTENLVNSQEKLEQLTKDIRALGVENANQKRAHRGRREGKKNSKSQNSQNTTESSCIDRNEVKKSTTSGFSTKNLDSKRTARQEVHHTQKSKKNFAANGGKISKQHGKGGQKNLTDRNKIIDKSKIDSIFNDLPEVPNKEFIKTSISYTKDNLLQLRDQQKFPNSDFNSPTTPSCFIQPAPLNPGKLETLNYTSTSPFSLSHNPTGIKTANFSCLKNEESGAVAGGGSTTKIEENLQSSKKDSQKIASNIYNTHSTTPNGSNSSHNNNYNDISSSYQNNIATSALNSKMNSNSASVAPKPDQPNIPFASGIIKTTVSIGGKTISSLTSTTAATSNQNRDALYPNLRGNFETSSINSSNNRNYSDSSSNVFRLGSSTATAAATATAANTPHTHTYGNTTPYSTSSFTTDQNYSYNNRLNNSRRASRRTTRNKESSCVIS